MVLVNIMVADKGHRFRHPRVHLPRATHARGNDHPRASSHHARAIRRAFRNCPSAAVMIAREKGHCFRQLLVNLSRAR